jgi:vanillate O-demethylase monooxygenase subunit
MSYLSNAWYAAGWSHELNAGVIARRFLDIPVMIYRRSDSSVVALHDRCPHRFAPLSYGKIVDDKVRCIYHGLEYDGTGACVGTALLWKIPVPRTAKVRTFPIVEQDHILWIWMGEARAADPARIPRFAYHVDPTYRSVFGINKTKADYRLLCDNLMDLAHIVLMHPAFQAAGRKEKFRFWEEGDDVLCEYTAFEEDQEFHTLNRIHWTPPSAHNLEMHIIPEYGKGAVTKEWSANLLTPESASSTHYFWSVAVPADSAQTNEEINERMVQVVDREDAWMIEGVVDRMDGADLWDLNPILLATDAGAVRMRRKLTKLIEAEGRQPPSASSKALDKAYQVTAED